MAKSHQNLEDATQLDYDAVNAARCQTLQSNISYPTQCAVYERCSPQRDANTHMHTDVPTYSEHDHKVMLRLECGTVENHS